MLMMNTIVSTYCLVDSITLHVRIKVTEALCLKNVMTLNLESFLNEHTFLRKENVRKKEKGSNER